MTEIPLCYYCRKSIEVKENEYVITNKEKVDGDTDRYIYAHVKCQNEKGTHGYGL